MTTVFADAGYWIALLNPKDILHERAVSLAASLGTTEIVTTQMVLTEFLNHYAAYGSGIRDQAVAVVADVSEAVDVEVVPQTSDLFEKGLALYSRRPDKEWGLSDCCSFVVMNEREITEALAYDEHFVQAGYRARLREL